MKSEATDEEDERANAVSARSCAEIPVVVPASESERYPGSDTNETNRACNLRKLCMLFGVGPGLSHRPSWEELAQRDVHREEIYK